MCNTIGMKLFVDTDFSSYKNINIILDIDGTICADGSMDVDESTKVKIQEIQKENTVYLCSNKRIPSRLESLAAKLGVRYIATDHRKPSKSVLSGIVGEMVVVGDKVKICEGFKNTYTTRWCTYSGRCR